MSTSDTPGNRSVENPQTPPPITIDLIAGYRSDGEPVMEKLQVAVVEPEAATSFRKGHQYRLLTSPAFVRGLAAGDRIEFPANNPAGYALIKRSGNLSIRVLRKDSMEAVAQMLTPELELLDGTLDLHTARLLVYSIHVSIGFQSIETVLDNVVSRFPGTVWYYGNVYDPVDGVTPLDWWQEFLAPV